MPEKIPGGAARKQAELCVNILARVNSEVALGHPADRTTSKLYREHREFGSRDRRFFSNLVFSWFRWRGWLLGPENPAARDIISAFLLDADDVHPAIEHLARDLAMAELQPMGNLGISEKAAALARRDGRERPPSAAKLVPEWTAARLFNPGDIGEEAHFLRCIEAFQARPPMWVRVKKRASATTLELMSQLSAPVQGAPASARALLKRADWENLPGRARAEMEIQDLASQCVGLICDPAPGQDWWDACAGAGGKALHLADIMGRGRVLATDIRSGMIREGLRRAQQDGAKMISFREWDGHADPAASRLFDGVLVDAPCSGLGTWHRNPDARWRTADSTVTERASGQAALLAAAASKVRPGGRLVYSVCTLTRDETEGVAGEFLKSHPEFRSAPGIHPISGEQNDGMFRIWPWQAQCNGMFIAAFTRE